jgi:UDP-N-acetylmuramate dehydrogenase
MKARPGLVVRENEPLSLHTPYRTGGPCSFWVVAHDVDAVLEVVSWARDEDHRLTVLGAGTRSLVRDGALPGVVMRLGTAFGSLCSESWTVGAGYPLAALAGAAASAGRAGLEAFACSPGSVGASLLHDDWDGRVASVSIVRRNQVVEVELAEAQKKRPVVLSARLELKQDDPAHVLRRTGDQWAKQKPAPCSSWYDPPKRGSLRRLLSSVRLPMVRLRQVAIAGTAPELLVNLGEGTAADFLLLHRSISDRISRVQGEDLQSRIKWLGSEEGSS